MFHSMSIRQEKEQKKDPKQISSGNLITSAFVVLNVDLECPHSTTYQVLTSTVASN